MKLRLLKFFINLIPLRSLRKKLRVKYCSSLAFKPEYPQNRICREAHLHSPEKIKLGKNIYLGKDVDIFAEGGVTIEDNVNIGAGVLILTTNHNFKNPSQLPYDNISLGQSVFIGKNAWIGCRSIILCGVKIEEGAVVGAGSVVTSSVPACAIVGGNPAKIIGWRDRDEYRRLEDSGQYYTGEAVEMKMIPGWKKYIKS